MQIKALYMGFFANPVLCIDKLTGLSYNKESDLEFREVRAYELE